MSIDTSVAEFLLGLRLEVLFRSLRKSCCFCIFREGVSHFPLHILKLHQLPKIIPINFKKIISMILLPMIIPR